MLLLELPIDVPGGSICWKSASVYESIFAESVVDGRLSRSEWNSFVPVGTHRPEPASETDRHFVEVPASLRNGKDEEDAGLSDSNFGPEGSKPGGAIGKSL